MARVCSAAPLAELRMQSLRARLTQPQSRAAGMTASRAQTSLAALLASAAVFSQPVAAQPQPAPASQAEREIVMSGETDALPAVVYGAPNLPVVVSFDSPLGKGGIVAPPGA